MPPAAVDQFFTSGASSLMHSNSNNNNNNNGSKTTLKNLISYNKNNNGNCLQDNRASFNSASLSCHSCLRYQQDQSRLSNRNEEDGKDERSKTNFSLVDGDHTPRKGQYENNLNGAHHTTTKVKSNTHRSSCTNIVNGLSHSYCKSITN